MDGIVIAPGLDQEGEGISLGLARGPVVLFEGENLAGEGMGIGAVAAKHGRTTYFARRWTGTGWRRTFVLDTRMGWAFLGCPSRSLAESIEAAVGLYMRTPRLQPVALRTFRPLRRVFCINPVFETVPPAGRATVTLGCRGGCATVQVGIEPPYRPGTTFCLLNELSADVFTASLRDGRIAPPPPPWELLPGGSPLPLLYDPVRRIRFGVTVDRVPDAVPVRLYWGRERTDDLCWAGFALEIGPLDGDCGPFKVRYTVRVDGEGPV